MAARQSMHAFRQFNDIFVDKTVMDVAGDEVGMVEYAGQEFPIGFPRQRYLYEHHP